MIRRLQPDLEKILVIIYHEEKASHDDTFHLTGPAHMEKLGIDTDSQTRVKKFRVLDEQGFLIDVGGGVNVIYYNVRLTEQGRRYCELYELV